MCLRRCDQETRDSCAIQVHAERGQSPSKDTAAKSLLTNLLGKIALRLHRSSQALENQIPKYAPYIVDSFNVEMVKKEILEKKWEPMVAEWTALCLLLPA